MSLTKENLKVSRSASGYEGFKVITSGTVTGTFGALVPYDGYPNLSAVSIKGDDLPTGDLLNSVVGKFSSVTVNTGTVLAYYIED